MKKKIVYIFILLIATIFQTSVFPVIFETGTSGDAVAMAVLAWAVIDGFSLFLSWAIIAGIIYDLLSYSAIGTHVIVFLFIIYFVSFFSRRFSVEVKGVGFILFLMLVVVSTFISKAVIFLVKAWEIQTLHGFWSSFGSFQSIILQLIYNIILFSLWFFVIRKTKKFFTL